MKTKTTLRIKDCKLVKHKVSKELDVPEFVNRGRQN